MRTSARRLLWVSPPGAPLPPNSLHLFNDVISEAEEREIVSFIDPLLKKKRYLPNHFDSVISQYREKELTWTPPPPNVTAIFDRLAQIVRSCYGDNIEIMAPHVIDLHQEGHIGAHVDSIKFSGHIVSSLSLQSSRVLRLKPDLPSLANDEMRRDITYGEYSDDLPQVVEVVLQPRSFYIISRTIRYYYTHEILGPSQEVTLVPAEFRPSSINRRISVMFRDVHKDHPKQQKLPSSYSHNTNSSSTPS